MRRRHLLHDRRLHAHPARRLAMDVEEEEEEEEEQEAVCHVPLPVSALMASIKSREGVAYE